MAKALIINQTFRDLRKGSDHVDPIVTTNENEFTRIFETVWIERIVVFRLISETCIICGENIIGKFVAVGHRKSEPDWHFTQDACATQIRVNSWLD
jgi:hypothetical protein